MRPLRGLQETRVGHGSCSHVDRLAYLPQHPAHQPLSLEMQVPLGPMEHVDPPTFVPAEAPAACKEGEVMTHPSPLTNHSTRVTSLTPITSYKKGPLGWHGHSVGTAQRLVWAAKQPLGNAALGALFA